jgi:hypothetical protein
MLAYYSGTFAFKQNKNLPPGEQLVICNPDIHSVSVNKFVCSRVQICFVGSYLMLSLLDGDN